MCSSFLACMSPVESSRGQVRVKSEGKVLISSEQLERVVTTKDLDRKLIKGCENVNYTRFAIKLAT